MRIECRDLASEISRVALRLRAAESGSSVSQLVNDALKEALSNDAADLDAFLLQRDEASISFEQFICDLRRRGRI